MSILSNEKINFKSLEENTFKEIIESEPIQNYLKYIQENQIKGCPVSRRN